MNKQDLTNLSELINLKIKEFDDKERLEYEAKSHKSFKKGDWVTNGDNVGTVMWVENLSMGLPERKGYFGLSIKNNNGGFVGPLRRDDYKHLNDDERSYYKNSQTLNICVTGEEIEAFFMSYMGVKNVNPSKIKDKLINAFEGLRPF